MAYTPFQKDDNGISIQSVNSIPSILNIAINTSTYVAVQVPATKYCKSFLMQTRDGSPFLLSNVVAGTTYATINQPLAMDFAMKPEGVICYVKATVAGTLEVILGD